MTELENALALLKSWGPHNYHTIYLDGKKRPGMRDPIDRIKKISFIPYMRRILDLGCNMGGMIWPYRLRFGEAIGIDKNEQCINFCKNILCNTYNMQNIC